MKQCVDQRVNFVTPIVDPQWCDRCGDLFWDVLSVLEVTGEGSMHAHDKQPLDNLGGKSGKAMTNRLVKSLVYMEDYVQNVTGRLLVAMELNDMKFLELNTCKDYTILTYLISMKVHAKTLSRNLLSKTMIEEY